MYRAVVLYPFNDRVAQTCVTFNIVLRIPLGIRKNRKKSSSPEEFVVSLTVHDADIVK